MPATRTPPAAASRTMSRGLSFIGFGIRKQAALSFLRDFGPRISERDRAVEHERGFTRVGVHAEVAEALELDARADRERRDARLRLRAPEDLERLGVQMIEERPAFGHVF